MPDLIRHPVFCWIEACAAMTDLGFYLPEQYLVSMIDIRNKSRANTNFHEINFIVACVPALTIYKNRRISCS